MFGRGLFCFYFFFFFKQKTAYEMFTIGQRKGLPGGSPRPRYVIDLDPETSSVIVGDAEDLVCGEFEVNNVNWLADSAHTSADVFPAGTPETARGTHALPREITVKIRYAHPGAPATV